MRQLTRHVLVCINSFNTSEYAGRAMSLAQQVHQELRYGGVKYTVVCAFGGCDDSRGVMILGKRQVYSTISENLSDHNIFTALSRCQKLLPRVATCVVLHDTCEVRPACFRRAIMRLSRLDVKGWIFAHALGLYNIGVCDLSFALQVARNWQGVTKITKEQSIQLEHTRGAVTVQEKEIPGLRCYSHYTLNAVASSTACIDEVDSHSIMPVTGQDGRQRHVVYLGALGVYKLSHTPGPFLLPIWVGRFVPGSSTEYDALTDNPHTKSHDWVRALVPHKCPKLTTEDSPG
jgi:hypothetical protein